MTVLITGCVFLERFHILKRLGNGSYGRVYEALDLLDGDRLAIKISHGDEYKRQRNVVESKILKILNEFDSPYRSLVVKMKMCVELKDCVVLVLELLSSNLLESLETNAIRDHATISKYAKQMVECLCFMSEAGVIHGDVKPENILHELKGDGIKFADFGLSHSSTVGEKAKHIQTIHYTAPEVLLGYDYDSAVDTWSVGCVLFECLTGGLLFPADDDADLMYCMGQIVGTLDRETIEHAPNRDRHFEYDPVSESWLPIERLEPGAPIGLRNHLQSCYDGVVDVDDPEVDALIDLIEGMLRLNPVERLTPEECLAHPYFGRRGDEEVRSNSRVGMPIGLERMYLSGMNLSVDLLTEALALFDKVVLSEDAFGGRNETLVMMACVYIECFKRKIVTGMQDFVSTSGINGVAAVHLAKTIGQITDVVSASGCSKSQAIFKNCLLLGLNQTTAKNAARIEEKVKARRIIRFGGDKVSIMAASIFIAAAEGGHKIPAKIVANVTGARERCMRRCTKLMIPHAKHFLQA